MRSSPCHSQQGHRRPASTSAKHVNIPLGQGIFPFEVKSLRHAQPVVYRSVIRRCASENQSKRVSIFPIGAMGTFKVSAARTPCSLPKRHSQLCKRESSASASASAFFRRGDGKFAGVAGTYISLIEPNINPKRKMRVDLGMSAIFPSGRWEVFKVSAARTYYS